MAQENALNNSQKLRKTLVELSDEDFRDVISTLLSSVAVIRSLLRDPEINAETDRALSLMGLTGAIEAAEDVIAENAIASVSPKMFEDEEEL